MLAVMDRAIRFVGLALVCACGGAAEGEWKRLSSRAGALPVAVPGKQQTASVAADLDRNGAIDIVIAERTAAPSLVWLRRVGNGWERYVIDAGRLRIEAGGVAADLDRDGDLDLVFGGDGASNQVWWWENPSPRFNAAVPWQRRLIKNGGGNKHHDQVFADVDGDGAPELVFWNQGAKKLYLARVPAEPKQTEPWPLTAIFSWEGCEMEGIAAADVNGDGKLDIVGGGRWFEHRGGDLFTEHVIDDTQRFSRAAAGQLKKGGWDEVAFVVGDGIGRLKWYEFANGRWTPHDLLEQDVIHGHTLQIADVDRDGNLDLFCGEMGKWIHPGAAQQRQPAHLDLLWRRRRRFREATRAARLRPARRALGRPRWRPRPRHPFEALQLGHAACGRAAQRRRSTPAAAPAAVERLAAARHR
jgi:hypothetical protein